MNQKELEAFAKEAAKSIKTGEDLDKFRAMLTMKKPIFPITVMVLAPKKLKLKAVNLSSTHRVTAMVVLSPSL